MAAVLELYYKELGQLRALVPNVILPLAQRLEAAGHPGISRVLLTFKGRTSAGTNPRDVEVLKEALPPSMDVSCVWSAKMAYVGSGKKARGEHASREDATYARFREYAADVGKAGCSAVLVVSGAGAKKALDSVETLSRLAAGPQPDNLAALALGVAFNPHIGGTLDPSGGAAEREAEWGRLERKLASGAVSEIWIAFGADVAALQASLARLQLKFGHMDVHARPRLYGSVFVPSKAWLGKMRFRCWNGTYLGGNDDPGGYLSGVEAATAVTQKTMALFARYGVVPVVESSVRTEREVADAAQMLLGAAAARPPLGEAGPAQAKRLKVEPAAAAVAE